MNINCTTKKLPANKKRPSRPKNMRLLDKVRAMSEDEFLDFQVATDRLAVLDYEAVKAATSLISRNKIGRHDPVADAEFRKMREEMDDIKKEVSGDSQITALLDFMKRQDLATRLQRAPAIRCTFETSTR